MKIEFVGNTDKAVATCYDPRTDTKCELFNVNGTHGYARLRDQSEPVPVDFDAYTAEHQIPFKPIFICMEILRNHLNGNTPGETECPSS